MGKRGEPKSRRAPVVRVHRRRGRAPRPSQRSYRQQIRSASRGSNTDAATPGSGSVKAPPTLPRATRAERAERRSFMQRLADAERRASAAERYARTAQKHREEAERRAEAAEKERDELLADQPALYDEGTELWHNVWDQNDTSSVLTFPTNKSVVCDSVERRYGGNCMPGVHAKGAIDNGRTTQSIWLKGRGYTLVGLVSSEDEKMALRHHAGNDYSKMPLMEPLFSPDGDERAGDVFTIEVDMTERRATLYVSGDSSPLLEPRTIWEGLPDKVWVAVAFKRNSGREAVLMPCIHWNMTTS